MIIFPFTEAKKAMAQNEICSAPSDWYSPYKSIDRTFRTVFVLPPARSGQKSAKRKPSRTYRNPVILAREWEKMLRSGEYASQTALARKLSVSRVRVTQVLNLLKLAPEALEKIAGLGDPLTSPLVTERKLRPIVNLPKGEQGKRIRNLLRGNRR